MDKLEDMLDKYNFYCCYQSFINIVRLSFIKVNSESKITLLCLKNMKGKCY